MKKRLLAVVAMAFGLAVVPSVAANATIPVSGTSTWACVIIDPVDLGVCQGNPLPDLPDLY